MRKGTKGLGWTCPSELGVDPWQNLSFGNGAWKMVHRQLIKVVLFVKQKEINDDESMMI